MLILQIKKTEEHLLAVCRKKIKRKRTKKRIEKRTNRKTKEERNCGTKLLLILQIKDQRLKPYEKSKNREKKKKKKKNNREKKKKGETNKDKRE